MNKHTKLTQTCHYHQTHYLRMPMNLHHSHVHITTQEARANLPFAFFPIHVDKQKWIPRVDTVHWGKYWAFNPYCQHVHPTKTTPPPPPKNNHNPLTIPATTIYTATATAYPSICKYNEDETIFLPPNLSSYNFGYRNDNDASNVVSSSGNLSGQSAVTTGSGQKSSHGLKYRWKLRSQKKDIIGSMKDMVSSRDLLE